MKDIFNTEQVAKMLYVSKREVQFKCQRGTLKCQKLFGDRWIIRRKDVEKYAKENGIEIDV